MNSPPRDQNAENANLRRSWPQVRALDSSDYGILFFYFRKRLSSCFEARGGYSFFYFYFFLPRGEASQVHVMLGTYWRSAHDSGRMGTGYT